MLERDYILRIVREFTQALEKLLDKKKRLKESEYQLEIKSMYRSFFNHEAEFYYDSDSKYIVYELGQNYSGEDFNSQLEMITELLLIDANTKPKEEKEYLLKKSLELLIVLDNNSKTYSLQRKNKINNLKKVLIKY